jgi:hypothetical protein
MKLLKIGRKSNTRIIMSLMVLTAILSSTVSGARADLKDCSAFLEPNQICADISNLAQTLSDGTPVPVSNGSAFLSTSTTSVKFVFTSNSSLGGKSINLQFFDISSGLTLNLPTSTCSSTQMSGCGVVAKVNGSGSVTIAVSISGAASGKVFKYQLNGANGFASGFVTTTFNSSGGGGNTPEACGIGAATICAPITRLSATSENKTIPITYDAITKDGTANIAPNTTAITYTYTSPTDYASKYVFVQFFDVTTLSLTVPGGSINSSTSCDPQPALSKGCKIQVAADGKASFTVFLSNASIGANFKYKISGESYDSKIVVTTVAVAPTINITAGKKKFTVVVNNANGRSAIVTYRVGNKPKTATLRIVNDAAQFNIPVTKGSYTVKVRIGMYSKTKTVNIK